ncbi:MAG: hypothetical protein WAV02_21220 [Stellaceae bacterium]
MSDATANSGMLPRLRVARPLTRTLSILVTAIFAIGAVATVVVCQISFATPAAAAAILISVLLAALPVLICRVQATAKTRQLGRLESIADEPAAATRYYVVAKTAISAVHEIRFSADYTVPLLTFVAVMLIACLMVFMSPYALQAFNEPNFVLGGMKIVTTSDPSAIGEYQRGTFAVMVAAFIGAYVYMLGRLLDRLNNNDFYPISFYYYDVRIVVACLVAAVFRHSIDSFHAANNQSLILLGFVTGLAPDLFILAMARKAFQSIKVFGSKDDPDRKTRPSALPLLMLDDFTKDKVDRFNELGIDSAQILACQNPFLIWPRLPYDLGLIVDWIAEAQLYALVKENALHDLRRKYVTDIFDLYTRLSDENACAEICSTMKLDHASAPALLQQICEDQSFNRLKQVRDALLPGAGPVQ